MKKVIFIGIGVAFLGLTSCKKDYTCACTVTSTTDDGAGTTTSSSTQSEYTLNAKKKDAEEWCKAYDDSDASGSVGSSTFTTDYSCSLK